MQKKVNGQNNSKVKTIGVTTVTKCFPRPEKQNNCPDPSRAGAPRTCGSRLRLKPSKPSPVKHVPSLRAAVPPDP